MIDVLVRSNETPNAVKTRSICLIVNVGLLVLSYWLVGTRLISNKPSSISSHQADDT